MRDYYKELAQIGKDAEDELYELVRIAKKSNLFEREDLGNNQFWYKLIEPVEIDIISSNEDFIATHILFEGDQINDNFIVEEGGYLFGTFRGDDYEKEVKYLETAGTIDFLLMLRRWIDEKD